MSNASYNPGIHCARYCLNRMLRNATPPLPTRPTPPTHPQHSAPAHNDNYASNAPIIMMDTVRLNPTYHYDLEVSLSSFIII